MPIFNVPLPEEQPKKPNVEITTKPYRHSVVDSKVTPIETLITFIGGSNWTVDYYSQVLGEHEALKPFDPSQHIVYQSYNKINRLIIKLQGSLDASDDTATGRMIYTGDAIITAIPGLIPNIHDVIIGDIGEGQAGQFTITSIQKLTLNKSTAYRISFELARPANERIIRLLEQKVVQNLYYRQDLLVLGQNPLLLDKDYNALIDLRVQLKQVVSHWTASFFSHLHRTFLVPDQDVTIYDQYVTNAIFALVSPNDERLMSTATRYNCDDFRFTKYTDVYQAIIKRDRTLLFRVFKSFTVFSTRSMTENYYQDSIKHSGVRYIVTPNEFNRDGDYGHEEAETLADYLVNRTIGLKTSDGVQHSSNGLLSTSAMYCPADLNIPCGGCDEDGEGTDEDVDPKWYEDIGFDIPFISMDSFVLSKAFYDGNKAECTEFERLLLKLLDHIKINPEEVYPFCRAYYEWPRLEQFYLGPLLIALIKVSLRDI